MIDISGSSLSSRVAEALQVCRGAAACQIMRGDLAADPQRPQRSSLINELVVSEGVHGDVRGQVTGPIGNWQYLAPLSEARQSARCRTGVDGVPVVDRDRETGSDPGHEVVPRDIACLSDLDAVSGLQMISWPESLAPQAIGACHQIAESFVTGRGVDEDLAELAAGVQLGNWARHDIEPFVGEDQGVGQAVELVRKLLPAGGLKPADGFVELRPGDYVDTDAAHLRAQPVDLLEQPARALLTLMDRAGLDTVV